MSEEKKPKIFVATPMYGGMCHGVYAQSMLSKSIFSSKARSTAS